MTHIASFFRFWYDFIVGDDWTIAVAVVAALIGTWLVVHLHGVGWWVLPVVVALIFGLSVWRAASPVHQPRAESEDRKSQLSA